MKVNSDLLMKHIDRLNVGGLINEVAFGKNMSFAATDDSKTVVVFCVNGFGEWDKVDTGIFNLLAFKNYIEYAREQVFAGNEVVDIDSIDLELSLENKNDFVKYLLVNHKVVSTSVANPEEILAAVTATEPNIAIINGAKIAKCLKAITLNGSERCTFRFTDKGAQMVVGRPDEHRIGVDLGVCTGTGTFEVVVRSAFLSKVLGVLPTDKDTTLEIRANMPLVFRLENYIILLASVEVG
jgi:hypothetical protein